ncbi:MAG: rhomboid family intramembrane serine protease [Solirubrobacterales bacterium]
MTGPELSVVCRNCGSEVSPYVTECPYCGTRIRKRAPRLEREGDEIRIREGRREKKQRERRAKIEERRESSGRAATRREELATRPWATGILLALPALLFIATHASGQFFVDARDLTFTPEAPRFFIAPYFYESAGYFFVCGIALAIFLPPVERRIGSLPALLLAVACGALSILGADGLNNLLGDDANFAAGQNGIALGVIAAYVALREPERRANPEESYDPFAVLVCALVVLLIPFVQTFAEVGAGIVGAVVGAACGYAASLAQGKGQ